VIHDRDPLFTTAFGEVFKSEGLRVITTLPKTRQMNAICERVIGTLRRELLDRVLILGERHLSSVLGEYLVITTVTDRTSPGASDLRILKRSRPGTRPNHRPARTIRRRPVVAGVISEYHPAA
jgi:transposase InsO family protein